MIETIPLQDRDLLTRLSQYFDSLLANLREGRGWLIFSAERRRANRIATFVLDRLQQLRPLVAYYFVPWRDFALNAYMFKVELGTKLIVPTETGGPTDQLRIANLVTLNSYYQMLHTDLLIVGGIEPRHPHEIAHLDDVVEQRYRRRLASMLVTPRRVDQIAQDFERIGGNAAGWDQIFRRMYETSYLAL